MSASTGGASPEINSGIKTPLIPASGDGLGCGGAVPPDRSNHIHIQNRERSDYTIRNWPDNNRPSTAPTYRLFHSNTHLPPSVGRGENSNRNTAKMMMWHTHLSTAMNACGRCDYGRERREFGAGGARFHCQGAQATRQPNHRLKNGGRYRIRT